jgi:LPXTG-site transpeptidase (sortase) family protein
MEKNNNTNNNKEKNKVKKTKLLKAIIFSSIGLGLILILYPVYTNFIAGSMESSVLSAWEEQKEDYFAGIEAEEEVDEQASQDDIEDASVSQENEEVTLEITGDTTAEVSLDYTDLTLEDFFPLKMSTPKIEVEAIVEEGTDAQSLKNGPGYEALTPLPGDEGRCTISGHRTTYGAPFNRIDELENGDLIYLETINDELLTYIVTGMEIIRATDIWILEGTRKKELLLTTCHPKYSAARRLVIIAELLEVFPFEITHEN